MTTKQMDTIDQLHAATRARQQVSNQHRAVDVTDWTREQHDDADAADSLDQTLYPLATAPGLIAAIAEPDDGPDYPLAAVLDMLESTIVTVRTVEDQLREHSRTLIPSADTAAFDALVKKAYLTAENDAVTALGLLQHAAQLVKGLAR